MVPKRDDRAEVTPTMPFTPRTAIYSVQSNAEAALGTTPASFVQFDYVNNTVGFAVPPSSVFPPLGTPNDYFSIWKILDEFAAEVAEQPTGPSHDPRDGTKFSTPNSVSVSLVIVSTTIDPSGYAVNIGTHQLPWARVAEGLQPLLVSLGYNIDPRGPLPTP